MMDANFEPSGTISFLATVKGTELINIGGFFQLDWKIFLW